MKVLASQSCPAFCDPMDYTLLPSTSPRLLYLSTEFSRQEYWSGLSFPSPEDLPNPSLGIEPKCASLLADSLLSAIYINKYNRSNSFANISVTKYERAFFEGIILSKDL